MNPDACSTGIAYTDPDIQLDHQPNLGLNYESSTTDRDMPCANREFNYPNKLTGYLAQEDAEFKSIGPDRQPVVISSIEQLMAIADIIRNTQVPNYKAARIPIQSSLNVKAWEAHVQGYSDNQVLQYIKFGYPLSLKNAEQLCNKDTTTHYSACQYPSEVQKYIDKEKSFGALLGPVQCVVHPHYHCSPLMTPLKTMVVDELY